MSRIYELRELDPNRIHQAGLHERELGPQDTARPAGGFQGFQAGGSPAETISHLEQRQREADRILENARREAEHIQREAYHEGFAQGERAGEKLGLQKAEPVVQALRDLIAAVQHDRADLIRGHQEELIKVAYAIAQRVLMTAIELRPEVLAGVVEGALGKVSRAQEITLRVAPYDYQLLDPIMRNQATMAWPPPNLKIVADESIGRGGCRVETETGDIDATIETQLRVLKNALWSD